MHDTDGNAISIKFFSVTKQTINDTPNFIVECMRSRTFHKRSQIVATIDESDINVLRLICMILMVLHSEMGEFMVVLHAVANSSDYR